MTAEERGLLLRFVTSVSRGPLGGFRHLTPPLTIHKARAGRLQEKGVHRVLSLARCL